MINSPHQCIRAMNVELATPSIPVPKNSMDDNNNNIISNNIDYICQNRNQHDYFHKRKAAKNRTKARHHRIEK